MNKNDAFKFAFNLFKKELNSGITEALESEQYYIFFTGNNRMIGRPGIAVSKQTQEYFFLSMPDQKTKEALIGAKKIDVPTEYFENNL